MDALLAIIFTGIVYLVTGYESIALFFIFYGMLFVLYMYASSKQDRYMDVWLYRETGNRLKKWRWYCLLYVVACFVAAYIALLQMCIIRN